MTRLEQMVLNLSGGNQQKVVLAKWLAYGSKILILDEPTKGIDIGTKASLYKLVSGFASNGIGILMISSELPEILGISDNILVLYQGNITGFYHKSEATQEVIIKASISSVNNNKT